MSELTKTLLLAAAFVAALVFFFNEGGVSSVQNETAIEYQLKQRLMRGGWYEF